ncbi:hypothetical protein VTK26DRAFT_4539 [Humicola hyalothermophila]
MTASQWVAVLAHPLTEKQLDDPALASVPSCRQLASNLPWPGAVCSRGVFGCCAALVTKPRSVGSPIHPWMMERKTIHATFSGTPALTGALHSCRGSPLGAHGGATPFQLPTSDPAIELILGTQHWNHSRPGPGRKAILRHTPEKRLLRQE